MFRIIFVLLTFIFIESVIIEHPSSEHIEERIRKDFDSIYRYYIIPHEIQFHANAIKDDLPYFLRCKGSTESISFTVPSSAMEHLSLDTDNNTYTITAKLIKTPLTTDLVGRYRCSDGNQETTVHVYIDDGRSVFTKQLYPKIFKQTGIHFFNLPCQTTSWYPRMSCSIPSDSKQCKLHECNLSEKQENELKCNTPVCDGQEICIPVYYKPVGIDSEKVFFDPQIGFALENPTIPNKLSQFTCMSNYTPSQESKIPLDSSVSDYIQIHQPSLTVMSDETLRLTCEIQYGTKVDRKIPTLFWFEDIDDLTLISNQTEKPIFNFRTQTTTRNSSITLRGFKPTKVYRFYCVRVSEQGLYSRSVEITCADAPTLDLEISLRGSDTGTKISYGSDGIHDITIMTIPRSPITFEISRNDNSLLNDKRFELLLVENQENQFLEYALTIYNVTFEDETDLKITAKSSALEKTIIIKPNIIGDPVGQLSFVSEQIPSVIPWRNEDFKNKQNIYSYGIFERESYRIVCTIRHRSDIKRPLNIYIQYTQCSIDNCLSNIFDKTCRPPSSEYSLSTTLTNKNNFQTQLTSDDSHILDDPSIGHQYLCCYEQNGLINIAKAITVLSNNRDMFYINQPEFSLVTGDTLTYRCEGHELIYDNLRMIYNDGLFIYERNHFDNEWYIKASNQIKQIDIDWSLPSNEHIRSIAIQVKTLQLKMMSNRRYFQCIGLSKRSDFIPNVNHTYIINVDDPVPLQFKNNLQAVSKLDHKAGDSIEFDCKFNGRPKPKIIWFKGKLPFNNENSSLQFGDNNESILITRAQPFDTGYYTCELNNSRDSVLRRSFNLVVEGSPNPNSNLKRLIGIIAFASAVLLLIMFILLIFFAIKYYQIKKNVERSIRPERPTGPENKSQLPVSQLDRISLPDNFATTQQIHTFLNYLNHKIPPPTEDDFKELGHGKFGVVYQVRLPEVDLIAAKCLPEIFRTVNRRPDKRKKRNDLEESHQMLSASEKQASNAAHMLINEMKVMHRAGKHVNIVALKKVAYPEMKLKFLFKDRPIQNVDSFYLMEFCSNGSLESMLKRFIQPSTRQNLSLYETLSKHEPGMTITQAYETCSLTDDDLQLIAYQVACGIDYLNRIQIAHCDIAPRNVLVTSRFIMKICDFGLATWTTYKNYREQIAQNNSVHLEKKSKETAIHSITPELAKALLRASTTEEESLLSRPSIKCDIWSFGIFLWTIFLKCQIQPFHELSEERKSTGDFFQQLVRVISEGHVLQYIKYRSEIPPNIYAIIKYECLVEENNRPEMKEIRARLCHLKMLPKQAFNYYRSEYNRYQEENIIDDKVETFSEVQGADDLPSFSDENTSLKSRSNDGVIFRPTANTDVNNSNQETDSYLIPINDNQQTEGEINNSARTTTESNVPEIDARNQIPFRRPPPPVPKKPNERNDSYR